MLLSQFTILYFWVEGFSGSLAFNSITKGLPVQDAVNEFEPLLQILIEPFKDDGLKILSGDSTTTFTVSLDFG